MKLPELPALIHPLFVGNQPVATRDTLQAYGIACAKAALEEAAKVCDEFHATDKLSNYGKVIGNKIKAIEVET